MDGRREPTPRCALSRESLGGPKGPTDTGHSLPVRPVEQRALHKRHDVRGQIGQLDRGAVNGDDRAVGRVELVDLRVQVVVLEPRHARRGQVRDDDAPVGRERERLRGIEAVGRALLEGRDVGPAVEAGVGVGRVVQDDRGPLEPDAVASGPGADPYAAAESDYRFGVSLACLRGCGGLENTSKEYMLPRHVSRPNIGFRRGNVNSENTYRAAPAPAMARVEMRGAGHCCSIVMKRTAESAMGVA